MWTQKFKLFFERREKIKGTGNTRTVGIQDQDNALDGCCINCEQATENLAFHGLCDDCNESMEYALKNSMKDVTDKQDDHSEENVDDTTSTAEFLMTLRNKESHCDEDSILPSQQTTINVENANAADATDLQKIVTDNNLICPLGKYLLQFFF